MSDPETYLTLAAHGETLLSSGEYKAAMSALRQSVEINPTHYPAWILLGQAQYALGKYSEAGISLNNAENCDPYTQDFARIRNAMSAQDHSQARDIASEMLRKSPGHPRAVYTLSHLFQMQGAHEARVAILAEGLDVSPANIALRQMLVGAYEDSGAYGAAIETAKQIVQIDPSFINLFALMQIYMRYGFNTEVLSIASKASLSSELDKEKQSEIGLLKGHALRTLGRANEAISAYQACLKNNSFNTAAMWALANMKTYIFAAKEKQVLQNILLDLRLPPAQKTHALFALAKAEEQQLGLSKAMGVYADANASHTTNGFNGKKFSKAADNLVTAFTPDVLARQATTKNPIPIPIFIVGLPRSGSTLIEQILASHSQIEGTMELPTLPGTKRKIHVEAHNKFNGRYVEALGQMSVSELTAFGQSYLDDSAIFRKEEAPYFIDKLPHNFEHIGLIHKLLPNAVVIDARRHPMDCGLSLFKQHFARGSDFSYNLNDIGTYYNGYLKIMDHWDEALPNKVLHIQYEKLVENTEPEIRKILSHIGLDFEETCLRFYDNTRAVRTASSEQVRQPVFTSSIGVWKTVEQDLKPLKESLGIKTLERFKYL